MSERLLRLRECDGCGHAFVEMAGRPYTLDDGTEVWLCHLCARQGKGGAR